MGTLIDGIAASEALDSSGERISVKGMDISSLEESGALNWEHKSETPEHILGRIVKAKKIFSQDDCETERELYFWNKIHIPFVYIIGELFDDVGHKGAQEVAAMLKYDVKNRMSKSAKKNTINFSIEGHKLEKNGQEITRSIARKCTLTLAACNKTAVAEMMPQDTEKTVKKGSLLDVFKTEEAQDIEVLEKADYVSSATKSPSGLWTFGSKPQSAAPTAAPHASQQSKPKVTMAPAPSQFKPTGSNMGSTKSGKEIFSHSHPKDYGHFSSADHSDAMNAHYSLAQSNPKSPDAAHHMNMAKLHMQFRDRKEAMENRAKVKKSDVAPSQRVGTDALMGEHLHKRIKKVAKDLFEKFEKKEELLKSIQEKHPGLTKHQVKAAAMMTLYKKEKELEEKLEKLTKG